MVAIIVSKTVKKYFMSSIIAKNKSGIKYTKHTYGITVICPLLRKI